MLIYKGGQKLFRKHDILSALSKILFGNMIMALAYTKWMIPNNIINGGVTSLALIINDWTDLSIPSLTNYLTIILLLLCFLFFGKKMFFKSLYSSLTYLIFFNIFYELPFNLNTVIWMDILCASLAIAFGYYCNLSANSSTVGVDVIALIIHEKMPTLKIAPMIRNINFLVLALGVVTLGLKAIIFGAIFSILYSWLLKKMMKE